VRKLLDWIEVRVGYRGLVKGALDEPVLGGASFFFVFGSVLLFLLLLQMTTGILLAFYYSPSATDAWASTAHIQDTLTLGWLIRGLHHHGASAMVIVSGLHLMQTAVFGAYKKPRELNWITGVMLLGLILAFALTGYLLPWDQTGYWATKVATGIAGSSPIVGAKLQQGLQGGNEYGNLTLTRFYALHVFVLPVLTLGLVGLHLLLFRRHGVTPSWRASRSELRARVQPFWPDQMFKDMVAMAVAFAALFAWTWREHGARLDAPADPSSNFDARPEWYFRPLFQLLKYFEGSMETIAALGVPAIVGAFLIGLPFLDRGVSRSPGKRVLPLGALAVGIVLVGVLTSLSFRQDAGDPDLAERQADAEKQATRARRLARAHGVPAEGGIAVYTTAPFYRARTIWKRDCASCHEGDERKGPAVGPGYNAREWIRGFLKAPSGDAYFGRTELAKSDAKMDPVDLPAAQIDDLVEMIYAESGASDVDEARATRGRALFDGDGGCTDCHSRKPPLAPGAAPPPPPALDAGVAVPDAGKAAAPADDGEDDEAADDEDEEDAEEPDEEPTGGPNLAGRGSPPYLVSLIRDASAPQLFGAHNEMEVFIDDLGPDDLRALAEWLTWLRTASQDDIDHLDDM
jgi:ubiquinol-cytochrome c reductase cytochrome b subunit